MTIEECYQEIGGSFADVSARLPSVKLIEKLVETFLDDQSYTMLCEQMKAGNRPEAFRAAHTLKGVCANLGFSRLTSSASQLTEILRPEGEIIPAEAHELLETVCEDYQTAVAAIRKYQSEIK